MPEARRYLEVCWGELLGEARETRGARTDLSPARDKFSLPKNDRYRFRQMARATRENVPREGCFAPQARSRHVAG